MLQQIPSSRERHSPIISGLTLVEAAASAPTMEDLDARRVKLSADIDAARIRAAIRDRKWQQ
jgi:hypothetical protein